MTVKYYPLWWNPWQDKHLDLGGKSVSISIDNLDYDPQADVKILFLAEPYSILPTVTEGALRGAYHFDKIYTFTQKIIDQYPQAELFEWGSSWLNFSDLILDKGNNVSFVTSNKSQTVGHKMRLEIFEMLKKVDVSNGLQYYAHKSPPFHDRRNDFFETAKFHITVENSRQQNYFTEKIIDCFASKTVPIYYGCPNLGDWFNMDGVIVFHDLEELECIMKHLDTDKYDWRQSAIEENYEIAKQFHSENDVVPRLTRKIKEFVGK
mgnify:FL=1|jgi:hypothetical protein|tara:strand:+ start:419 stop:1210 length:792 start_codon:yes stop_codon:yes gene_type:complete